MARSNPRLSCREALTLALSCPILRHRKQPLPYILLSVLSVLSVILGSDSGAMAKDFLAAWPSLGTYPLAHLLTLPTYLPKLLTEPILDSFHRDHFHRLRYGGGLPSISNGTKS